MTQNNPMRLPLLKTVFPITIFLLALFIAPQNAHADVTQGLLESCSPQVCGWNLHCPGTQLFGQSLMGVSQKCRPEKDYEQCGTSGNCSLRSDGRTNCVTIDNISGNKTDLTAAICLDKKDFPQKDKGNEIKDQCVTTANCGPNQQCIQVTAWDQEYFGISEFVTSKRCLPTEIIPATFVFTDTTGSCGQNQQCGADETCVENTYLDIVAKAAYVPLPGFFTFKQPVCYKSSYLSGTCTTYGATCQVPGTGTGLCMHTLDAGADILKCVDVTYLPGGPAAPSNYACTSDASCNKTDYKYCLTNPVTSKKQCFSQQNIFTDMSKLPAQTCSGKDCTCSLVGKQGCEPSGKESICAAYGDKSTAVCINYAGGGAALSDGKGAATTKPSQLPDQSIAQQTYTAFAPKLQIDIPNLTFAEKITAEDGPGGIKRFSVPYLATYINAVYKYALGLGVLIAVIVLMYAGFRWMTSFGNSKAVSEAKTMVGNSAFGLFLLFSAFMILYYINPELPKMKALQILAPKQIAFDSLNEEEIAQQTEAESGATPTGDREACLMKTFAPGKKYGDKPDIVSIEMFELGTKVPVNQYSAAAWQKVSKEILASSDPEVQGILQYMHDFKNKKVPDMTGAKDGAGAVSALVKCIGCNKKGELQDSIGNRMHPIGLALDFMTRSGWAIKWGPKEIDTGYCNEYKKTLDKMKSGEYGEYLKSDPYKMYARLTPLAESCVNKFNNGKWTIWPKKFVEIFNANGFRAGENYKGLYTDAMHFEYFGPCMNVK